jgi:competence ComEA-like helix-hairpin-helix protein
MKNGKYILLLICALSLSFILGMFAGRNTASYHEELKTNDSEIHVFDKNITTGNKLDINTATKVQLMELPGIGEVIADRIITFRTVNGPFSAIDQLIDVEGIGEVKLRQIETYICIGG